MDKQNKKISISMIAKRSGINSRTVNKFLNGGDVRLEKVLIIERTIREIKEESKEFNYNAVLKGGYKVWG